MLTSQIKQFFHQLPTGRHALALVWRAAGWWTVVWGILLVAQGLVPAGLALLLRTLVNRLVTSPAWSAIAPPAIGIAALWVVAQLLSSALSWVRAAQAEYVQDEVHRLIHEQALRVDLAFYDDPDSYDQLYRAQVDAVSQPLALLESLGSLVQNGLGFLVLAGILWTYAAWLPMLLVFTAVPGLILVARQILKEHRWHIEHTFEERRARYLDWMITDSGAAAELRLFDLGTYHRKTFEHLREILRYGKLRLVRQGAATELVAGLLAWAGSIVGLGWMLHQTIAGKIKLGDLLLCFQAFQQCQSLLRSLLEGAGKIYRSLLFIENLDDFLKIERGLLPGPLAAPGLPVQHAIRFERVSFTYPGGSHRALDQFDLEIPAEKVVALVGHNGAGKSTLIKLMCRFYDPSEGRVLLDGVDLRELDQDVLRRRIAVLFQQPVHYCATASENIAFGDIGRVTDRQGVQEAARDAGALEPIERLPAGFETVLGKWFGGTELSGGEWQRIALARAFFRQASLVVLDEPTSAMDSWGELDWLSRFRALVEGKTALMITHRFTTAMHADIIHVMDKGRVVESGTHAQLVALGGAYASSWAAQMREIGAGDRP
ncbi:MAG: ABC transporter ATP-binding protein [Terracidiphilus sp.]|jgi:ATP-binding cassette subfamily B protein